MSFYKIVSQIKNSLPWLNCEYVCGYELVVIYLLASRWRRLVRRSLQEIAVCHIYAHHHVTGASVSSQQMIYYRLCGATQVTPATAITDSLEIYWYFADSWFYVILQQNAGRKNIHYASFEHWQTRSRWIITLNENNYNEFFTIIAIQAWLHHCLYLVRQTRMWFSLKHWSSLCTLMVCLSLRQSSVTGRSTVMRHLL